MDRLFDFAFVRPPSENYVHCVSSNPERDKIDITLAREQHRNYVSVLKEVGVRVVELEPLNEFPDSVFMQDPAILGTQMGVIGRFGQEKRRGEEHAFAKALGDHNEKVSKLHTIISPGTLEGGDIVVTDREIFVGVSSRTNMHGIQQLAEFLSKLAVKPVTTDLFHLLCGCSYLSDRTMTIAPELVAPRSFPGFRFVEIPKEEAYACDALYVGDKKVIIPEGYEKASGKLRDAGYTPLEVDVSEFRKGDGGVTCLCSPIYKVF